MEGGGRERRPTPGTARQWRVGGEWAEVSGSAPTHLSAVGNLLSVSALDVPNPIQPDGGRHAAATSRHSSAAVVKRRSKNRPTSVRLAVAPF